MSQTIFEAIKRFLKMPIFFTDIYDIKVLPTGRNLDDSSPS